MSTELQNKKSGRTPEQQAARDARKAAKAKAAAEGSTAPTTELQPHAESSKQALAASPTDASASLGKADKKRRRKETDDGDARDATGPAENEEDLLEIDVTAPEPLSKAEARLNRKRQKKGLPELPPKITKTEKPKKNLDADEDDDEGKGKAEAKEEKPVKQRLNSVWIGNLSFRTTAESLKTYLEKGITEAGGVGHGSITRVNLPKKTGKGEFAPNKGFAYVDFATPELQALGVGLSETFFEGRKLLIKKGDDHTVKPDARTPRPERAKLDPAAASILKKQIHPESATLFVGNLPFDATEEGLRDMIEQHAAELPAAAAPAIKPDIDAEAAVVAEAGAEEVKDGEEATGEETKAEWVNPRGGKVSGLRKVRLGAFEDTGRCKGFAFLDFHSPQEATRTLVNRKNHFYGSRKLNVQYASESATKRSGGNRNQGPENAAPKPKRYFAAPEESTTTEKPATYSTDEAPVYAAPATEEAGGPKRDHRGKRWEAAGRPRPGAALAMAKREKVGIVKAEGAKITFD